MTFNHVITPYAGPPQIDAMQRHYEQQTQVALMHMAYGAPQPATFIQPYDVSGPIVGTPVGYYPPRRHNELPGIIVGAIVGAIVSVAIRAFVALSTAGIRKARGAHRAAR